MNVLISADKSINHKITGTIHAVGLTDIPYSALFFIFRFIHLQNVKMFTCNVFRMFLVFCVLILQFFVITTLLTDCRGHWRVPVLLCAYELHGLLVLSGVLFLDVVGQASCSRPFLVVAVSGRPLHEVIAGSSISCLHQAQNVFVCLLYTSPSPRD